MAWRYTVAKNRCWESDTKTTVTKDYSCGLANVQNSDKNLTSTKCMHMDACKLAAELLLESYQQDITVRTPNEMFCLRRITNNLLGESMLGLHQTIAKITPITDSCAKYCRWWLMADKHTDWHALTVTMKLTLHWRLNTETVPSCHLPIIVTANWLWAQQWQMWQFSRHSSQ